MPDEAGPGGGADCETGRGSSLMQAGERMGAMTPWRQQRPRQQRADAVGHKTPGVWSDLGSFVKSALSEDETGKQTAIKIFFSSREIKQFKVGNQKSTGNKQAVSFIARHSDE